MGEDQALFPIRKIVDPRFCFMVKRSSFIGKLPGISFRQSDIFVLERTGAAMLLMGVKEENGWLCSQWNLTYGTGWTEITKAVKTAYPYYENVEILVDNIKVDLQSAEEVLCLEEGGDMVIRGTSTVIKVPMMVKFYNQLQMVDVWVACATDEFKEADYQSFNLSMGQYMDSMELAMYC